MALNETNPAYEAEATVTQGMEDQGDLVVVGGRLEMIQRDQAMKAMLDIGLRAGRVQAATLVADFANALAISQVRELKDSHKAVGLTWAEACKIVGISTQRADQILRLGNALGDDFVANADKLGLSFRTLEAARQLPEPVRQALAQGQVVDLEAVTKEALTGAILQLAREHGKEKADLEEALTRERKSVAKAVSKHIEAAEKVSALGQELESLREGLDADEARVLRALHEAERPIAAHMVRIKNTLDLARRSPAFIARLVSGLEFIRALADYTAQVVLARAEGQAPDEEALGAEARQLNQDIADSDGAAPHPGV